MSCRFIKTTLLSQLNALLPADDLEPFGAQFLNPLKDCIEILHAFSHATLGDTVNIEFNGASIVQFEESFPDDV